MEKTNKQEVIVSTEEFWRCMHDFRFHRISLHCGAIENTFYHTNCAPEEVEGFIERKMEEAEGRLKNLNKEIGRTVTIVLAVVVSVSLCIGFLAGKLMT